MDLHLLRRLQAGDESAFETFFDENASHWVQFLTSHKHPHRLTQAEAEDVVQETMVVVWSKVSTFEPAGAADFSTWCLAVAAKIAIGRYRERVKFVPIAEYEGATAEHFFEGAGDVRRALFSLNREEQIVMFLKAIGGLTHAEIAHKLGKTEAAVRVEYYRARKKLKSLLEGGPGKRHGTG